MLNYVCTIYYICFILLNVTTITGIYSNSAVIHAQMFSQQYFITLFGML